MIHPYRELAANGEEKIKKKFCFIFHDWEINLKPESYNAIIRDSKEINGQKVYFIDIFEDYNLKCSCCKEERSMTTNPFYWQLALQDAKEKFKGFKHE